MMKKEDFHENQIVVAVKDNGERKSQGLFTVLEVHDSHMVLMSPWSGLDAVFYQNSRTTYSPATLDEVKAQYEDLRRAAAHHRWEAQQIEVRCRSLADAVLKLR